MTSTSSPSELGSRRGRSRRPRTCPAPNALERRFNANVHTPTPRRRTPPFDAMRVTRASRVSRPPAGRASRRRVDGARNEISSRATRRVSRARGSMFKDEKRTQYESLMTTAEQVRDDDDADDDATTTRRRRDDEIAPRGASTLTRRW